MPATAAATGAWVALAHRHVRRAAWAAAAASVVLAASGLVTVMPKGEFPMGKTLAIWAVYLLAIGQTVVVVDAAALR